jgi:hypothetical protein
MEHLRLLHPVIYQQVRSLGVTAVVVDETGDSGDDP